MICSLRNAKHLNDDGAGNLRGWDPDGIKTTFGINDPDIISGNEAVFITVSCFIPATDGCDTAVCAVNEVTVDHDIHRFRIGCTEPPADV